MERLRWALILSGVIFSVPRVAVALGLDEWKKLVVKIEVTAETTSALSAEGSGVLLTSPAADQAAANASGNVGVLSSEHIYFDSVSPRVHVFNARGADNLASLGARDYMTGLLQLAVPLRADMDVDWLRSEIAESCEGEVYALGFPFGTADLRVLGPGKISETRSRRALIPMIPTLIEVTGLPIEFGMSGGILLCRVSAQDYKFVGILSHQYLRREASRVTELRVTDVQSHDQRTASDVADLTLVIPAAEVKAWYDGLKVQSESRRWRHVLDPLAGRDEIHFGALIFRERSGPSETGAVGGPKHGEVDASGVGGARRGDADGSGIGGEPTPNENSEGADHFVEVSLDPDFRGGFTSAPGILRDWQRRLSNGEQIRVRHLFGEGGARPVNSLPQFFTWWLRDGLRPMVVGGRGDLVDARLAQLKKQTARVRRAIKEIKGDPDGLRIAPWLETLREESEAVDNFIVEPRHFATFLTEAHQPIWDALVLHDFETAAELEAAVRALANRR